MTDKLHSDGKSYSQWSDFEALTLKVGIIREVEPNPKARKPAYIIKVDLGPLGIRTSSAQLTDHYDRNALIGKRVLCVCNFEPKRIAGVKSEVLITGACDEEGKVVLASFDLPVPAGADLM